MKIDFITKKIICENCSRRCSVCKEYVLLENMVKCPNCSRFVCKNCSKSEFIKINGKILCKGCSMKCPTCGNIQEKTSFKKCENCIENCNYLDKCFDCRKQLCVRLKRKLNLK
jgi:hypothetical protein